MQHASIFFAVVIVFVTNYMYLSHNLTKYYFTARKPFQGAYIVIFIYLTLLSVVACSWKFLNTFVLSEGPLSASYYPIFWEGKQEYKAEFLFLNNLYSLIKENVTEDSQISQISTV